MKVRIKKTPREDEVDGVRLDRLEPGTVREVSASVGSWLIAERYAGMAQEELIKASKVPSAPRWAAQG